MASNVTSHRRRVGRGSLAVALAAALLPFTPLVTEKAYAADPAAALETATWLRQQTKDGRILETTFNGQTYDDDGLSVDNLLAQVAAGAPPTRIVSIANEMAARASKYTKGDSADSYAGATGKLLLAADVVGMDTKSVGGVDLAGQALSTIGDNGKVSDVSAYGNYANNLSQAYVILALARTNSTDPEAPAKVAAAVAYLASIQCDNGSFGLDNSVDCSAQTAPDRDATALAINALKAAKSKGIAGADAALSKAVTWLVADQQANGGWGGGTTTVATNANSTGLAVTALAGTNNQAALDKAQAYIKTLVMSPTGNNGADRGAIAYSAADKPGGITPATVYQFTRASTQGIYGLVPVGLDTLTMTTKLDSGAYVPASTFRILDTRNSAKMSPDSTLSLQVAGVGGIPKDVGAVALNVTVTDPTDAGFITAYPSNATMPNASNLNFTPGQVIPNVVIVKVGPDGKINLTNSSPGKTHLVADVVGYYTAGDATVAGMTATQAPARILDTRETTQMAPDSTRDLKIGGGQIVPAGATAAIVNVTVTNPTASGFVTVSPTGTAATTSNLNFVTGETRPTMVISKLGTDGSITLASNTPGTSDLVVDLVGWVIGGAGTKPGAYVPASPTRILDDRVTGQSLTGGTTRTATVGTTNPSGSTVSAVMANVTAADPTAPGYLTIRRGNVTTDALTSTTNFVVGMPSSNAAMAETDERATVGIRATTPGKVSPVLDTFGHFVA